MRNKFGNALTLARRPGKPIGLKPTRASSNRRYYQALNSFSRDKPLQKKTNMCVSTPRRNGQCGKPPHNRREAHEQAENLVSQHQRSSSSRETAERGETEACG